MRGTGYILAYIMVAATTIMLDVVNRSIHKENFDNSKMV